MASRTLNVDWIALTPEQFLQKASELIGGIDPAVAFELFDEIHKSTQPAVARKLIISCATAACTTSNQTHVVIGALVAKFNAGTMPNTTKYFAPAGMSSKGYVLAANMSTARLVGHIAILSSQMSGGSNKFVKFHQARGSPFDPKSGESEYMKLCREASKEFEGILTQVSLGIRNANKPDWLSDTA